MKQRFFYCAILAMLVGILTRGTLAYFTDKSLARNVITMGTVGISVVETYVNEDGETAPYPEEPIRIVPGSCVSKIVQAAADPDSADCYVRMRCDIVITNAAGELMTHTPEDFSQILAINFDTVLWTENDGWWYYNGTIADEEMTPPLFTEMGNEYMGSTIFVDVTAQAVQADNNGDSALEAAGWPAE